MSEASSAVAPGVWDEPDLDRLYRQEAGHVWQTLARFGIPERDRKDLTQEVFIVAHRKLGSLRAEASARAWLYGISRRVAAAHRRRAWFRRETASEISEALPDPAASPEEQARLSHARRQLERILSKMKLDQRAVFVMYEIDRLDAPTIASQIGCPVPTVHSRLAAARKRFEREVARLETIEERSLS